MDIKANYVSKIGKSAFRKFVYSIGATFVTEKLS